MTTTFQKFLDLYGGGPFCLSVGFKAPHEQDGTPPKFIVQERYKELYKNVKIPAAPDRRPQVLEQLSRLFSHR